MNAESTRMQAEAAKAQAEAQQRQTMTDYEKYLLDLKVNDPDKYAQEIAKRNNATDFANMSEEQYNTNVVNAASSIEELAQRLGYNYNDFAWLDFGEKGTDKYKKIQSDLRNLYTSYGLTTAQADEVLNNLNSVVKPIANQEGNYQGTSGKKRTDAMNQAAREYLQAQFKLAYAAKYSGGQSSTTPQK